MIIVIYLLYVVKVIILSNDPELLSSNPYTSNQGRYLSEFRHGRSAAAKDQVPP